MPRLKTPRTATAERALGLYRSIAPCFATVGARAEALGISEPAVRKWERGELLFVRKSSSDRALLLSETCGRLTRSFSRKSDIGAYLLHPVYEVDRLIRPLDLVVARNDPEIAVELLAATRAAMVDVAKKVLPADAFTDQAWSGVLPAETDDERKLEDELRERAERHGATPAL